MPGIDPTATLGDLVARRPARASLFEQLGLDFCCGGARTLVEACEQRGLDPHTVGQVIQALDHRPDDRVAGSEDRDWRYVSVGDLCDHVVTIHHERLRRELPQIEELLDSVMRVHGPVHRELHDLPRVFSALSDALDSHLDATERRLFPACRAVEAAEGAAGIGEALLAAHADDQRRVGGALAALRELTNDYDSDRAVCRTHSRLLEALRRLELDTHQHIHEEANILFPRVSAMVTAAEPVR